MKWFKHISDSLDDPFIFDLMDRYGADGYLVFFGIIEIYAREFKPELEWKLDVTRAYLRQKLHKRQDTLIIKILKHIRESGKWDVSLNGSNVVVYIPKFAKMLDNWTIQKLRSKSVVAPKKRTAEVRSKKEKQNKKKKEIKETNKESGCFELFWKAYPKKIGIGQARKTFQNLTKSKEMPEIGLVIEKIAALKTSDEWVRDSGQYIPHPSTWLDHHGWHDEPQEYRPDLMPKSISEAERLEERMRGPRLKKEAEDEQKLWNDQNTIADKQHKGADRPALTILPKAN